MIDYQKYNLDEDDIDFIKRMEDYCIGGQSELVLLYNGHSFVIEPSGTELTVVDRTGTVGEYANFDDLLLGHRIEGKPLIELIKNLDFGE